MPSTSPFTEEGRTRFRNFQQRFRGYAALWMILGVFTGYGVYWYTTRHTLEPLQRLYLTQYAISAARSSILKNSSSQYILLVRTVTDPATRKEVTLGCTDDQVDPMLDEFGHILRDKQQGLFFKPKPGLEYRYFYWKRTRIRDREMARWLRQNIYHNASLVGLFYPSPVLACVVFLAGLAGTTVVDFRINKRYEDGHLLRGTRSIRPVEYEDKKLGVAGLGIPIYVRQRRVSCWQI